MSAQRTARADGNADTSARGVVVTCALRAGVDPEGHEARTRKGIAQRLAKLKGCAFAGEFDAGAQYATPVYFVPSDTLLAERASKLGVDSEDHLYGGVVQQPFAATKAITHPLLEPSSRAPAGWVREFPEAVAPSVLSGFTVFTRSDLTAAVRRLLERGPARVKRTMGIGGSGQYVIETLDALDPVLDEIDDAELSTVGVVVEENLDCVTTYSVGQVHAAGVVVSYHGTQRQTVNNRGNEVYGGSELFVTRGDFDALLRFPLAGSIRLAVAQARNYDAAARTLLPGFFASRRNYDVMQGTDANGHHKSGVLEQSWRIGGASGAEVAALEAFHADPALEATRAVSIEIYGDSPIPPADATVYFRDVDARVGFLTKYSRIEPHADARRAG